MPKLILQFEDRVLHEYAVGLMATIGRLRDNTVTIDNPAVSSHHACVFRDGSDYIVEDLKSRNGTFVNDHRVTRHPLRHGDVVLIGKHKLLFDAKAAELVPSDEPQPALASLGDTIFLDTKQHKALLAKLTDDTQQEQGTTGALPNDGAVAVPVPTANVGVLRVLAGGAGRSEYRLESRTSLIGASADALVRLHGWFAPKVAMAIARNGDVYVATRLGGKTLINGERLNERRGLKNGDILTVGGIVLEFRSNE